MKALKCTPAKASLRLSAERRLRAVPPAGKSPSVKDLRSAVAELHIYEAELEIQNEELLDSRAQVEESQKKYFRYFDLAPVGLIRLNGQGLILEANILGAQMLDVNRALLHSGPRPFLAHVAPGSVAVFEQHLESALASGKMETCEVSLRNAAGRETFVRMQSVISRSEKDETDFYITLTDLTERREIEQKLALQKVRAEAAVASKELFFGMLSHELRTPLTPLVAILEDLGADRRHSVEDLAAFAIMRRNLDLEIHLIDDLLDLTRMRDQRQRTPARDRARCHAALGGRGSQPASAGLLELDQERGQIHARRWADHDRNALRRGFPSERRDSRYRRRDRPVVAGTHLRSVLPD
jgi:signal transduction histidine kinase